MGVSIDVHLRGPHTHRVREELEHAWSSCLRADPGPAQIVLTLDTDSPQDAVAVTSNEVTQAVIGANAGTLWMLHAAGLDRGGRVIALVAPSGTGKTTAARHLGRRLGYVSDETVAIGHDGHVVPYAKPLSLLTDIDTPKQQASPIDLGLRPAHPELRLARIALLIRHDIAVPEIKPIALGESMVRLAAQTSYLRRLPSPLQVMAGQVERTGGAVELHYSNVHQLGDLVDEVLT